MEHMGYKAIQKPFINLQSIQKWRFMIVSLRMESMEHPAGIPSRSCRLPQISQRRLSSSTKFAWQWRHWMGPLYIIYIYICISNIYIYTWHINNHIYVNIYLFIYSIHMFIYLIKFMGTTNHYNRLTYNWGSPPCSFTQFFQDDLIWPNQIIDRWVPMSEGLFPEC